MANPITTSSAFTTSNMKPVSDEVITADWGQKIAENTGWLACRTPIFAHGPFLGCQVVYNSGGGPTMEQDVGTSFFCTPLSPTYIFGTSHIYKNGDTMANPLNGTVYVDGTVVATGAGVAASTTGSYVFTWSKDITHLSPNTIYALSFRLYSPSAGGYWAGNAKTSSFLSLTP